MLNVTLANAHVKRTIRPLYANTQATPYGCFLDTERAPGDILAGSVMVRTENEKVALMTSDDQDFFGLSALFAAPVFGIDETVGSGMNLFAVWVGDNQSVFEVLAPAFDTSASWSAESTGEKIPLYSTLAGHAEGAGKLTPDPGANVSTKQVATLISVVSPTKIIVSLDNSAPVAATENQGG